MFGWAKKKKHKNATPQASLELDDIFGIPIDPNSEGPPILGKMTRFFLAKGNLFCENNVNLFVYIKENFAC